MAQPPPKRGLTVPLPANQEEWERLLMMAASGDRGAGDITRKLNKSSAAFPGLMALVFGSAHEVVRQLAAILLRQHVAGHWGKFKEPDHKQWQQRLLEHLVREPSRLVRKAISSLIGIVARLTLPANQWPELLPFLFQCYQSPQPELRELALNLFYQLTEHVTEFLKPHFATLHTVLIASLRDADPRVRVAALRSFCSFISSLTAEQMTVFTGALDHMLEIVSYCMENNIEDEAITTFEIMDDLMELGTFPEAALPRFLEFILRVGANQKLTMAVRSRALYFILFIAHFKPKALSKAGAVPAILQVLFPLAAEPDPDDVAEGDEMAVSPFKFACDMIDTLAEYLPTKYVFGPVVTYAVQYLKSPVPLQRRAALMSIALLADGCSEPMIENLNNVLPLLVASMTDADQHVRASACVAMNQFSRHLQPDILDRHAIIIPVLFKALSDPSPFVQTRCLMALEAFCEELEGVIMQYMHPMMARFVEMLQTGSRPVQELVLVTIGSIALASESEFLPYFAGVMNVLEHCLTLEDEDNILLRCRATECIGVVAVGVGKEVFAPYLAKTVQTGIKGLAIATTKEYELREHTMLLFSNLSKLYCTDFAPFVPTVVPIVLASMMSPPPMIDPADEEADDGGDLDENDEEENAARVQIGMSFFDEKSRATMTIGSLARFCGPCFLPFLEKSVRCLLALFGYFNDNVRAAAMGSMHEMILCVQQSLPPDPATPDHVPSQVADLVNASFPELIKAVMKDEAQVVACNALDSLGKTSEMAGARSVQPFLQQIAQCILAVLRKQTVSQGARADDEEDDHLIELLDSAGECLVSLCKCLKAAAEPLVREALPLLASYCTPSHPATYRASLTGAVAAVVHELGASIEPYVQSIAALALTATADSDSQLKRNAAVCIAHLAVSGAPSAAGLMPQFLQHLRPLFSDEQKADVVDNAAGAVAKMITAGVPLPLPEIIPVFLRALPVREDLEEAQPCYAALLTLLTGPHSALMQNYLAEVLRIFAKIENRKECAGPIRTSVATIVRQLAAQPAVQAMVSQLAPELQERLSKYLTA